MIVLFFNAYNAHVSVKLCSYRIHTDFAGKLVSTQETLSLRFANNKDADKPKHPRSLISAFVVQSYINLAQANFHFSN